MSAASDRIAEASAYGARIRVSLLAELAEACDRATWANDLTLVSEIADTRRRIRRAYDNEVPMWAPLVGILVSREPVSMAEKRARYAAFLTDPATGVCPAAMDAAALLKEQAA